LNQLIKKLDEIAGINSQPNIQIWLKRLTFFFLILMTVSAPHSIAATQTSWLLGMLFWIISIFLRNENSKSFFQRFPDTLKNLSKLDILLLAFFAWTVFSAFCSYAPDISLSKLRSASLFIIFFFVINNLRSKKAIKLLTFSLIASSMVAVLWTPIERIFGRGVEIQSVSTESPLTKATIIKGDTLLKANGQKIGNPDDLIREIEKTETTKVDFYRDDYYAFANVKRADLLNGNSLEKLGVENWKSSRRWRSAGFYGHYTTFAEVLQLIISLIFGIFIGIFSEKTFQNKKLKIILFVCLGLSALALLMTVTRASQLAFVISAFSILIVNGNRKLLIIFAAFAIPVVLIGLFYLQQTRKVGFFDTKDNSISWRQTVYREGFDLATSSPRHLAVGVGMDSIKRFATEWHLFDDGKLPMGHFHSTPLQLAVERGIPALLLWLLVLGVYWKQLYSAIRNPQSAIEKGILLGCFGGLIGFFTSGLVHYNLGDGEVAMVFFLLMGISTTIFLD
jgi:O-Antigen ligase/PDZ domain